MTKRRRILYANKIIQNFANIFCLLMFLQLKGYYSLVSNPSLLYSTASDIRVVNISKPSKVNTIIKGLQQGSAVDFLYRRNLICWSDHTAELIQCMDYNDTHTGEKMRIVSEGLITPTGIAIDWYTDKIYWTDGETNKIEVISIEQKYRKVLYWSEVDLARAIAVVPNEGLMFWTDWGEEPKIERAGMNGDPSTRRVIVKNDIYWPNGITIDYNTNSIFWVDAKLQFVDVVDFNGEKRKTVVKGGLEYPYALTFFNDKLYWTDWKTWAIYSWDISTSGPIKELIKSEPVPVDIKIYDDSKQPMPVGDYPCKVNNGGCSHLCLLSPSPPGYTCACPTGVKLRTNSTTACYSSPQSLLLVAQRSSISRISLDSPDFTPYTLPLKDLKRAITVDFDPKTEYFYWADSLAKTISRARLDGSEQQVVIHSGGVPDSIAIDPYARNIYWTDPVLDTISVARLNGSARKVIIHDDLYDPRAIALHPTAGWMFWSDWNDKKPKIERANLDGSGRILLVSEKLMWPNGIALDTANGKLYWGDARTHKIEVCNMDGTDRRELHNNDIKHIFGLTLLGEHLYWTDMQLRTLDRIDKNTGLERQSLVEQLANMMGVKACRLGVALGWNRCVDNNGGCSHLCFNLPNAYVCSCPLGLELTNDRKTCVEPDAFLFYSRKNVIGQLSVEYENNDAILPVKDLKDVSAIAVHVSGSKLYWADSKLKTISRCSINGANSERIIEFTGLVEGLDIDWSAQNIYWTDSSTQRIEVARLDGSSRRTLVWQGVKKPKAIVLDPRKGYMYWSELGSRSIKRALMDGSSPTIVIEQASSVTSLVLDNSTRLYWTSIEPALLETSKIDGSDRRVLVSDVSMPYALVQYKQMLVWGDWNTGLIQSANKTDGSNRRTLHSHLDYISDLKLYHRVRTLGNQCGVDNGGCSHLCLPLSGDYRCSCPKHYKLNRDNITCSDPEEYLLFAQKNSIGRIMVTTGESNDAVIPLSGLRSVRSIEFDPVNKHLYWIDDESHTIRRVLISHTSTTVTDSVAIIGNTGSNSCRPLYICLDVLGRALYWSCSNNHSISAVSLDNSTSQGVLVTAGAPTHLALHNTKRILIWNDVGMGAIMRANVDGTERSEVVRVRNVTSLCVDQTSNTLYWALNRQIHAQELDGTSNKRVIWQGGWAGALAIYSGSIYFSNAERNLMRIPLHRREAPAMSVPHASKIVALVAVHRVAVEHACYGGGRCGSEPGSCISSTLCGCALHCAPANPPCALSVPPHWRCDGLVDCADGSDEGEMCACGGGAGGGAGGGVRCVGDVCADTLAGCVRGASCGNVRHEQAFRCDDRLCLDPRYLCDEKQQCEDGTDESIEQCRLKEPVPAPERGSKAHVVGGAVVGLAGSTAVVCALWRRCRRHHAAPRKPASAQPEASESLCERYLPTANPPPSPASNSLASLASRRRYRHYRAQPPPPPTPASTDAAESEPEAPPPSPNN